MKCLISILSILVFLFCAVSCSEDDLGDFQQNDPEPEYRFFTMLDDYPALRSAFNSVDSYRFNDMMCEAMNDIPGDVKAVLEVVEDLLVNRKTDTLNSARRILYRILNQDELDRDPINRFNDPGFDPKGFPYYDLISEMIDPATEQKVNFTKPILAMQRKMFAYLKHRFTDEELEDIVADFIVHLRDDDATFLKVILEEVLAKVYFQGNENIWYHDEREDDEKEYWIEDEDGNLIKNPEYKKFTMEDSLCSRDEIGKEGTVDSGLGNAVRGSDASFSAQEELMKDPAFKEAYYDFLREAGKMMAATVSENGEEKNYGTIFKEFICNVEKHLTKGGEVYESDPYGTGEPNNNYQRGYVYEEADGQGNVTYNVKGAKNPNVKMQENPVTGGGQIGKDEYVNAELGNTIREIYAVLQSLFVRSDKIHSTLYDKKGKDPYYFLTRWLQVLKGIGFDPDEAHIEEMMYDLVRFDPWGRDRLANMNSEDLNERPFVASFMFNMLMTVGMSSNFGWWDAYRMEEVDEMGDFAYFNNVHGPYEASGYFTINDALYYMGFNDPMALFMPGAIGLNLYELAMRGDDDIHVAQHTFRSTVPFSAWMKVEEGGEVEYRPLCLEYQFNIDTLFNAMNFYPTSIAGDAGVPWGGNPYGWDCEDSGDPDCRPDGIINEDPFVAAPLNEYRAWSSDGRGEPDVLNMFMSSYCRFVWDGEGAFYSREGMTQNGNVYTYKRPDGSDYVNVTKPDPNNPLGSIANDYDPHCMEKTIEDLLILTFAINQGVDIYGIVDAFHAKKEGEYTNAGDDGNIFGEYYGPEVEGTGIALGRLNGEEVSRLLLLIRNAVTETQYAEYEVNPEKMVMDYPVDSTDNEDNIVEILINEYKRLFQNDIENLDYLYIASNYYQESDDWYYFYPASNPVSQGGEDLAYDEKLFDFDYTRFGQRKNCRYNQRVQTDYAMMHLDNALMFLDESLLQRDINGDTEIQNFVDTTGEYTGLDPETTTDDQRLVKEQLSKFNYYDIYVRPNEEIGVYGDITGANSRQPLDALLVAANPDKRIKWENEQLTKFKAGRTTTYELVPQKCFERECDTHTEALYRNLQFYLSDKKFGMGIPMGMFMDMGGVLGAMASIVFPNAQHDAIFKNFVDLYLRPYFSFLNVKMTQAACFMIMEANGGFGLGQAKFHRYNPEDMGDYANSSKIYPNSNGKWKYKRVFTEDGPPGGGGLIDGGQSCIPGDSRMYIMYVGDDLMNMFGLLMNDFLDIMKFGTGEKIYKLGWDMLRLVFTSFDLSIPPLLEFFFTLAGINVNDLTSLPMAEIRDGYASWMANHMLGEGSMMGGTLAAAMPGLCRIAFPRSEDPENPGKIIPTIGSRKGELLKSRDWKYVLDSDPDDPEGYGGKGGPHLNWGFETNDDDVNWPKRNSFLVEAFIGFVIAQREAMGTRYDTSKEFHTAKIKALEDELKAMEDANPDYEDDPVYQEKKRKEKFIQNAPNNDFNPTKGFLDIVMSAMSSPLLYYLPETSYPKRTWQARLVDDNCIYKRTDKLDDESLSLWESYDGGDGKVREYEYLEAWKDLDPKDKPDSWEERYYYQPAHVQNLLTMQCDSDPYNPANPKLCDGMMPIMTEYDATKPPGPNNPPNTRLITALFKMALAAADPKFEKRPDSKSFDENDYSTWSTNEKMRYGTEQLFSSIKCSKGDRIKINEANMMRRTFWPDVYTFPKWMFNDYGKRPEDIDLDKIIDELIGSDESGKGLAIIPDNRPNPEDWNNFYLLFEAQAELMSDIGKTKGEFNIMEDLIELIDLVNTPEASDEMLKGLRHSIGSIFTQFDHRTGRWEYSSEVYHIITDIVPDILETFKGRYRSLCNLTEAIMAEDGFMEWFIYTLDSDYSGQEIFQQLHDFLGEDFIAQHDSSFWEDFAELMTGMASLIDAQSNGTDDFIKDDIFHSNDDVLKSAQPFEAMGELMSW